MPSYIDSYYSRTLATRQSRDALAGRVSSDCVVIGAGFAGLFAALTLARGGMRPIVLDTHAVGWGASGRNGGFVSPGYATGRDTIAARVGDAHADALMALSEEGVEIMRALAFDTTTRGADPVEGILRLRRFDDGGADLKALSAPDTPYLDRAAIRVRVNSGRYFHGLEARRAFHIHPLNTLRALADQVERLGGRIFENSAVTGLDLDGQVKQVRTAQGQADAPHVVFATGGYTGGIEPRLCRAMLPIATYVMVSEAAPELLATAIQTPMAIGDERRAGDYYRLVEGGNRLLWGGRITTRASAIASITRQLRREMTVVYLQLADLRTEIAWSGLMSYARHLMPQIGQLEPGVWHVTAFGGHGLNTTAIGGTVVGEAILGTSDRVALFAPFGLNWAGGPVGRAVAQGTYWALQVQDWWRERRG